METLVALAIIAALLGLVLPAVQSARGKAQEAVCKNNLHQLNIAVGNYVEAHRRLPPRNPPDLLGGWSLEVLPFLGESNLYEMIPVGAAIAETPAFLSAPPAVFRCPVHTALDDAQGAKVNPAHYALEAIAGRESFFLYEVPLEISVPWASGPEIDQNTLLRSTGPHQGGYFYASGFKQGVKYLSADSR